MPLVGAELDEGFAELDLHAEDAGGVLPKDDNFKETVLGDNGEVISPTCKLIKIGICTWIHATALPS